MKEVRIKSYVYMAAVIGLFVALLYAPPEYPKQYRAALLLRWA
jgi:hypothetical protein